MITDIKIRPFLPLLLILGLMAAVYLMAFLHPWSWNTLKSFQGSIAQFHAAHPFLTPVLFICLYIFCALVSFPAIFMLSLFAGFLFKQPYSTAYVTCAATIGASLLFLAARTAFGELLYRKAGSRLTNLKEGFQENAASYLLFLRLFPFFPFWLVNVAGAFFAVPFLTFAWTTFLGMIPSVFIYTQAGQGFAMMLENPAPLTPAALLNANLLFALIGLALLSLAPLLFKKVKSD